MRFTFTEQELLELITFIDKANAQMDINSTVKGIWTPVYDKLIEILDNAESKGRIGSEDEATVAWVAGAKNVNGESGLFADFIREYTIYMQETRGHTPQFPGQPEANAQAASNGVARNFFNDIKSRFGDDSTKFTLPTIRETGENDAGAAAQVVFNGEYVPWAGTLLFPYLGYDEFFKDWVLITNSVSGDGSVFDPDQNFVVQTGTYDLISVVRAGYEATISAAFGDLFNPFEAFANSFLQFIGQPPLGALDGDHSDLIQETNRWFYEQYGLTATDGLNPGDALVFNNSGVLGGERYQIGTIHSDNGTADANGNIRKALRLDPITQVANAGAGDDIIIATFASQGFGASDFKYLVDGGDGSDTLLFEDNNITLEFERLQNPSEFATWRVVTGYSDNLTSFFDSPPTTALSGFKNHYIYNVENFILTQRNDRVRITDELFTIFPEGTELLVDGNEASNSNDLDVIDFSTFGGVVNQGLFELDENGGVTIDGVTFTNFESLVDNSESSRFYGVDATITQSTRRESLSDPEAVEEKIKKLVDPTISLRDKVDEMSYVYTKPVTPVYASLH